MRHVINYRRTAVVLVSVLMASLASASAVSAAVPPNDNWTDAPFVLESNLAFSNTVSTTDATLQLDEPQPCGGVGHTVWYSLAPMYGAAGFGVRHWSFDITTAGSNFDTVIAVYRDSGNPWPDFVGCNDNDGPLQTSAYGLDITLADSETFLFQVGGKAGASGTLAFHMEVAPPPSNDDFGNAHEIVDTELPYTNAVDLRGASTELDDAILAADCGGRIMRSVWYSFTPDSDMEVIATTLGSDIDTGLTAGIAGLTASPDFVACNDDDGALTTSALSLSLLANKTYYFAAGTTFDFTKGMSRTAYGTLVFNLSQVHAADVGAGGTLTTNADPTPSQPVGASVTTPNAGHVSISMQPVTDPPPDGYSFIGQQVVITAPAAISPSFLVLVFLIDGSLLIAPVGDIVITRNGVAVDDCTATGAVPDPCVASRVLLGNGDAELTVRTTAASTWRFATSLGSPGLRQQVSDLVLELEGAAASSTSKGDVKKLGQAVAKLHDSLDPGLWVDDSHLMPNVGKHAFQLHKDAVQHMTAMLQDKKGDIGDPAVQAWIDGLVAVDRAIAQKALEEAAGGDPKKLAKAAIDLAKGDHKAAQGKPDDAIEQYKEAWQKAQKAA